MGAKQHTVCPHGLGESRQLIQTGALHEQANLEPGDLHVTDLATVDSGDEGKDLLLGQLLAGGDLGHDLLIHSWNLLDRCILIDRAS